MAKPQISEGSSEEAPSNASFSSEEEDEDQKSDEVNQEEEDDEELEAVTRTASSDEDDTVDDNSAAADDSGEDAKSGSGDEGEEEDEGENGLVKPEVGKRERARLKELQRLKKQKIKEILDAQNAAVDADMNNKGKGRLKYLLQQTEIFAHFAKGSQSASEKKPRGRGRHESKLTEEEEDEECLKEEEDGLSGAGSTRLMAQPSCFVDSIWLKLKLALQTFALDKHHHSFWSECEFLTVFLQRSSWRI